MEPIRRLKKGLFGKHGGGRHVTSDVIDHNWKINSRYGFFTLNNIGQSAFLRLIFPNGKLLGSAPSIPVIGLESAGAQKPFDATWRDNMGIYRVFTGDDGESHIEELSLEEHPELGALTNLSEVKVQQFDGTRKMDFHPLPERRLIIHLSGEVEIGTSDGSRQVFRAGDIRLMEDVSGRGHSHIDRSPSSAVYVILKD